MSTDAKTGDHDEAKMFKGVQDAYRGVKINSSIETCDIAQFPTKLEESLSFWSSNNIRAVWFSVALEQAEWIPVLVKNGFKFHHTKNDAVVMYKWLPKAEPCNIPPYAHTMVGVGGLVVNSSGDILVVKERFHLIKPHWKLPGGYVEPGENIGDAAIREVFEETRVRTKFESLVSFRHAHNANFGCSDLYFIANLRPLSEEIEKCSTEIDACIWMKVDDYLARPDVIEGNKFFVRKYLEYKREGRSIGCEQGMLSVATFKRPQCVFSIMINEDIPNYNLQSDMANNL